MGLMVLILYPWEICVVFLSEEMKTLQQISRNLTKAEHRKWKRLSGIYGAKCGALFGVTASGVPFLLLKGLFHIEDMAYLMVGMMAALAVVFPLTLRFRRPLEEFLFSTEYAKEHGLVKWRGGLS